MKIDVVFTSDEFGAIRDRMAQRAAYLRREGYDDRARELEELVYKLRRFDAAESVTMSADMP